MELAQVNFQRIKRAYVDVDVNVTMSLNGRPELDGSLCAHDNLDATTLSFHELIKYQ